MSRREPSGGQRRELREGLFRILEFRAIVLVVEARTWYVGVAGSLYMPPCGVCLLCGCRWFILNLNHFCLIIKVREGRIFADTSSRAHDTRETTVLATLSAVWRAACSAHALAQITLHTPLLYSRAARRGPAAAACSAGLELPEDLLGPLV